MGVVEQYWGGVLQRLRAEVDVFARLVQHVGERGRMNELALSQLLESFVPERVGVGTGVLIDANDTQSQQTDVILFDRADQPAVMAQTTQVLFPVEVALACVEVKTTLSSGEVKDCLEKRATLHTLVSFAGEGLKAPAGHPPFVVLGYDAGMTPKGFVDSFGRDLGNRPDLLCVLEIGLVGGGPGVLWTDQESWEAGLALAQENADGGWQWVTADGTQERVEHEGRLVAVVEHEGGTYAADPAELYFFSPMRSLAWSRCARARPRRS